MARIRTVKPEFFRHEKLQELGPLSMLIFSGLWTQCDKAGRFAWKPRQLKLDILPFIAFDMEKELDKLADHFFVIKYEVQEEFFGVIPTFGDHQRLSGKEAQEPARYPDPPPPKTKKPRKLPGEKLGSNGEAMGKHPGSDGERQESQEGNGEREKEREGNGSSAALPLFGDPLFLNIAFRSAWDGWVQMRNTSKPKLTDHAKALNFAELKTLAGDDSSLAIQIVNKSIGRGWKGFFPLKESHGNANHAGTVARHSEKNSREFPESLAL
jgi:hypothetical protein